MRRRIRLRDVTLALVILLCGGSLCTACLRETLDDRAVEWSKLIVVAKLDSIAAPVSLISGRRIDAKRNSLKFYQIYDFEAQNVLDGQGQKGAHLPIIQFITNPDTQANVICEQPLTNKQIGKQFLLFLRPETELRWSSRADQPDLRSQQVHDLKAFVVVHIESMRDLGDEGFDDAKYTVTSTRQAESQFNPDDAKVQIQTLLDAADDTEQAEAEHAIQEMGPKALPALNRAMAGANDNVDRARLTKMIDAVSPPTLTAAGH